MIVKSIKAQNFLSLKNFELNLENRGLLLLNGENLDNPALNNNGAGKSSILESIVYALYGKTLRGLKGDAVIHRSVGKNMKVFLDLVDDDGSSYRIARYRKHDVNKNKSLLYKNGKDISPKSEADFENYVSDLLQADYTTFTASLLYSAESFKFATATDSEIKKTFDTMLGLDILRSACEVAKQRLRLKNLEQDKLETVINVKENDLKNLLQKLDSLKQSNDNFKQENLNQIERTKQSLYSLKEKSELLEDELQELEENKVLFEENLKKSEQIYQSRKDDVEQLEQLKNEFQKVKDEKSKLESTVQKHQSNIKNYKFQINFNKKLKTEKIEKFMELKLKRDNLFELIGTPCNLCGQPLTEESLESTRHEYSTQIKALQGEIDELDNFINEDTENINKTQEIVLEVLKEIKELKDKQDKFEKVFESESDLKARRDKAEVEVMRANKRVYSITSDLKSKKSEIAMNNKTMEDLYKILDNLVEAKNPFEKTLNEYTKEVSHLQEEIQELKENASKFSNSKKSLEFWEQAFSNSGIKSYILDDITPFLNRRLNKYLNKLTSGQIEAVFSTTSTLKSGEQREKFSLSIVNKNGGGDYVSNSAGERKRIDLSINLALQDLIASRSTKKLNIAVFDEVFDSLDENGVDGVISLLQELAQEKSTILVVSHNEYLKSFFTNVITVVKKCGFSMLKE